MPRDPKQQSDLMNKVVSLCKRRGYVFRSSDIYGGLRSAYDFGPLGVELRRNIADCWWSHIVHGRDDVVGFDASIIMHPKVWQASGHTEGFFDPLVDCLNCKQRFRADKAPRVASGTEVPYSQGSKSGKVGACGYICPYCKAPTLSEERRFNLMFQTRVGALDPLAELIHQIENDDQLTIDEVRQRLTKVKRTNTVYLRPETAQSIFVQFANILRTGSKKIPFGVAQIGKSFRNEIVTEHFIFRSFEFEQMELEYFVPPDSWQEHLNYWKEERLKWYLTFANNDSSFRLRQHEGDELAHYAQDCYDIEYRFPWGWDELEGVASRGDYDLDCHRRASGANLSYFDQQLNKHYLPYVIEPSAGLTRAVLAFLLDAYREEYQTDSEGEEKGRVFLQLHPRLAPYKAAIMPLIKDEGMVRLATEVTHKLKSNNLHVRYDDGQSIGRRYARHDEIGTPFCITVDEQSLEDGTVTLRHRDTTEQQRVKHEELTSMIVASLA